MKVLRITSIVFLSLVLNVLNVYGKAKPGQTPEPAQTSRIVGVVLDKNDARIVDASVKIENKDYRRQLRSDDEGRFEVELPSGIYQITVQRQGFRKFQLPSFRANAGVQELVNIHMELAPSQSPLKITKGSFIHEFECEPVL